MNGLAEAIKRCNVQLKLDNYTEGYGNCFPNAIIQQCRRPEINNWLSEKNPIGMFKSPQALRRHVTNFALNCAHKNVNDYKKNYETVLSKTDSPWNEYWESMERDGTWVDSVFIQITAWFIGLDIQVLTTTSEPNNPYIFISGNIHNPSIKSAGPPMLIGNYSNVHYQSLVPIINKLDEKGHKTCEESDQESGFLQESFIYSYNGVRITFPKLQDEKYQCPFCKKNFARIMSHVSSRHCTLSESNINIKEFGSQFSAFKEGFRLAMGRKRKQKSRMKLKMERGKDTIRREQNESKAKSQINIKQSRGKETVQREANKRKAKSRSNIKQAKGIKTVQKKANEWKEKSRNKLRVEKGPLKLCEEQSTWKLKSRKRKMESDPDSVHKNEVRRKKLSRTKQKLEASEKLKKDQRKWDQKRRLVDTEKKRLKKFRRKTMYNAIFTCMCCQRNLFECNVIEFTEELFSKIEDKKPGLYKKSIELKEGEPIKVEVNGVETCYVCHACKKHLLTGKLPPMSAMNGLKIHKHTPDLELTELEGNLIAKNIVFMKIFQLPKSRWTALKDKIINVPVTDSDIINTVTRLPRTPNEAGLIEVDLKRKVEYKNSHIQQLIDPEKCFKMLKLLKRAGNIHYQFYDDYNIYQERCKKEDSKGYSIIFEEETELMIDISERKKKDQQETNIRHTEEVSIQERIENEYLTKDPVRRYQFEDYNKSLCMSNMYPEVDPVNSIILAPGEGKIPKNILFDDDWDIKAFPHLNSPDGKYGLHHQRERRLQDQYYFIQRICNSNSVFARSPSYVYAAVAHTELKQIMRNINISFSHGKETNNNDGVKTLKMEDPYAVLDDVKQTPRYWKKAKHEMLAKLDNFGPFQFFFTLSCADLRWNENFAAILRQKGLKVRHVVEEDTDGFPCTTMYINYKKDGKEEIKEIKDYLETEVDNSLHELLKGNVLLATRYFNHRVKQFLNEIVMGGNSPMCVDKYSYKVEFQERGAGHVHGVLWVNLHEIEHMRRLENGSLIKRAKYEAQKLQEEYTTPFSGITKAFRKFRSGQELKDEERGVIEFIDQFTTVSLCANEVGAEVVRIVTEVNTHHHTKTCLKGHPKCRFRYPKFPIWRTILVRPYPPCEFDEEKAKNLKFYADTLAKVKEVLEDKETIESIMAKYNKKKETKEEYNINRKKRILELLAVAEISEQDYVQSLSYSKAAYSVHLKRDIDEIYINSYDPEWIRAWNGNIDKQPCFDYFGVITYVTDYFTKDETGTMEVLKEVLDNNPDDNTKEKMKKVASTFLSHRQIGEAEAFFKLLPDLCLKNSNVACQWLYTGRKSDRFTRMKKADENDKECSGLVKLEGVDGLWYEQPDMLSKYKRRPDKLELICSSHYARMTRTSGKSNLNEESIQSNPDQEMYDEDSDSDDDDNMHGKGNEDPYRKFHYIMTEADEQGEEIPKYFKLKEAFPKENPIMQKRSYPAALRFHKVNRENNPHKYFLSQLMLFIPFRDEEAEFRPDNPDLLEDIYLKNQDKIQKIKSKVMEHLESVEEARYYVEEVTKKIDLRETGISLDAAAEQENAECQEELDEQHPDYVHIDTDNVEEIENEGKTFHNIYPKIDLPNKKTLEEKTRQLDKYQRNVIDIGVKYAKDIIRSQREGNAAPKPPYLMVHGGAGAGKSHAIASLAEWVQYLLQKSGDDINCPYVIKTSFTGAAASLIQGMTLHSAFGFEFGNKHYSLSDRTRDARRNILKNLKMIIIDEISMVKADMLYQLDLRLQEIKERIGIPFGGVSIFCFGDIMQLQPVCGRYIFDRPQNSAYHLTFELDSLWHKFSVLNLELNHRQGKDKVYADMLNRVREGKHTKEDIEKLKEQIRPYGHIDLESVDLYIVCLRETSAKINKKYLDNHPGNEVQIKARHIQHTQKNFQPRLCKKEGTVGNTSFMDLLRLKKGCKIILIHNIDTPDQLTNGQLGTLTDMINTEDGTIAKLIVEFKHESVGKQNRAKNPEYAHKYPRCTVIEKVSFTYPLNRKATSGSCTATLIQFPVKLAYAITAHKIQGQTITKPLKVALDIASIFDDAQAHVMLSRVEEFEQIFILEKLPEEKIRASAKALKELEAMNQRSMNQNPITWKQQKDNVFKLCSLNSMNLENNFGNIFCDPTLKESTLLALSETWLEPQKMYRIDGYESYYNNVGPGKGIAIFYKPEILEPCEKITENNMQISQLISHELNIIVVYRSEKGNLTKLLEYLKKLIEGEKNTVITGDFNLCYIDQKNNKVSQYLIKSGFTQLVNEPTHIKGRHLDHLYFRPGKTPVNTPSIYRYSPYYSDHDAICATIKIPENSL